MRATPVQPPPEPPEPEGVSIEIATDAVTADAPVQQVGAEPGLDAVQDDDVVKVESVEQFLAFLSEHVPTDVDHWYRGHASQGWLLTASVFRSPTRIANELIMLKRFIQEARRHHPDVPTDRWDITFLAQHNEVPTRVLDWSESPLVGLYFAALDHLDDASDPKSARPGRVWILKPTVLNAKQGFGFKGRDLPMFGFDAILDRYTPFEPTEHHEKVIAAIAPRTFSRINAQWGTFTISTRADPLELLPERKEFLRAVEVPVGAKSHLRQQLAQLGMSDRTIFMDLFRLGLSLNREYS